jgi:hypothetical protein
MKHKASNLESALRLELFCIKYCWRSFLVETQIFSLRLRIFVQNLLNMTATLFAYEEVAEFIGQLAPAKLLELKPSEKAQNRVVFLVEKKKEDGLSFDEQAELDRFLALENLIAMAKAQARLELAKAA